MSREIFSPLLSHRLRNSHQGPTPLLPPIHSRRGSMHTSLPPINYLGRHQLRKALQPQASGFCLPMAKLPWLDDLCWLPNIKESLCMPMHNGIFHTNPRHPRSLQKAEESRSLLHQSPAISISPDATLLVEPPNATITEIGAWWMGNQQIPPWLR